jgi:prepilin-type N-terminal cleavage/methylation domain-containing protein
MLLTSNKSLDYIKKHMKNLTKKGFTLIELLIVIALLGALAVGLLAAVDPFEQLKKGRDTATRNTAAEFFNAMIRYYANAGKFPGSLGTANSSAAGLDTFGAEITSMAQAGELKTDFYNLAGGSSNLSRIRVTVPSTESVVVCFNPESKSFRNDKNTIYTDPEGIGTDPSACPNATSTSCYVCFR